MPKQIVGFVAGYGDAKTNVERIVRLEKAGVPAAWLTTGGVAPDGLTTFAAAAARTEHIILGSSITPIWPRHPIAVAQQVLALASLAPGRFRLGLGNSNKATVESGFGYSYVSPLAYMEEYVQIVKTLLGKGSVDFDGKHLRAHARLQGPPAPDVPIMVAALTSRSYEAYARLADGLISWVCPPSYLRDKALPAMKAGAQQANRAVPPLIAHVPVCVHPNIQEARAAAREQLAIYPRVSTYQSMFKEAGFPEASQGAWSDAMLDAVVAMGTEEQVTKRLREVLSYGAAEIIAHPITAGPDKDASYQRAIDVVAAVNRLFAR